MTITLTPNPEETYTLLIITPELHERMEREGWSIFDTPKGSQVQKDDEFDLLKTDKDARRLARAAGVDANVYGYVLMPVLHFREFEK